MRIVLALCAGGLALGGVIGAGAAETDVSDTPIVSTNPGAVKPNIMLLMDTSSSMAWTHMPDDVEIKTGINSVGYKNSQCNVLYYDPTKTYLLPKDDQGNDFPTPSFTNAPWAGFGAYYPTPYTATVDLSSGFMAYDGTATDLVPEHRTLLYGGSADTPQPAYYYVYSGTRTSLDYTTAPCTDLDTGATKATSDGTGTWQRIVVGATTGVAPHVDERTNFAIWFSYYRTRISLIKSAASLAFTPLNANSRIGYLSVLPYDSSDHSTVSATRYLKIADFDATQRQLWFNKLFSQSPYGSSPTREGLSRVGRMYAGQHDLMNNGMADDPVQYSCQQNFTILTTDGYWNSQDESTSNGGPRQIDGTTAIGQQDGEPNCTLSDSDQYCARPIYDGNGGSVQVVKDATNSFGTTACARTVKQATVYQPWTTRTNYTASYKSVPRRTQTWKITVDQQQIQTVQTTETVQKTKKTTVQYWTKTHIVAQDRYQIKKSQFYYTKTTQQQTYTKKHQTQQTLERRQTLTQRQTSQVQWKLVRTQWTETDTQTFAETRQYSVQKIQTLQHQYRYIGKPKTDETYVPMTSCTPSETQDCLTIEISGPTPVDPDTCTSSTVSGTSPYVHTDCTPGPLTLATQTTASCTPGTTNSGSPNYVRTICTDTQLTPPTAVSASPACTNHTDASNVRTICTNPAGPNNATTVGKATTCTTNPGTSSPFIKVDCTQSLNETTYPLTDCTIGTTTEAGNITRVCSQPVLVGNTLAAGSCAEASLTEGTSIGANNLQTTCTTTKNVTTTVAPSTCVVAGSPRTITSPADPTRQACADVGVSPSPTATTVAFGTCTAVSGESSPYKQTVCSTVTDNTNTPIKAGTCTNLDGSVSPYAQVVCSYLAGANNTTIRVTSTGCTANSGTASPFLAVTCTGPVQTMAPTVVNPTTCTPVGDTYTGDTGTGAYTRCEKVELTPLPGVCVAGNTGDTGDPATSWIQTDCTNTDTDGPSPACTLGTTGPDADHLTTCYLPAGPNNMADVPVPGSSCSNQTANAGNSYLNVTCNTTTSGPTVVDPATCPAGSMNVGGVTDGSSPFATTTCVTAGVGTYATPTFVDSCTPGMDGSYVVTQCSNGPRYSATLTNYAGTCTNGSRFQLTPASDHAWANCTATDVSDFVYAHSYTDVNSTGLSITYGAPVSAAADATVPSCTNGTDLALGTGPNPTQQTTVFCSAPSTSAKVNSVLCTGSYVDGTDTVNCGQDVVSGPSDDLDCADTTQVGTGTYKHCTDGPGVGVILQQTTTYTTTTSVMSGTTVIGTPNVVTSTVGPTAISACVASIAVPPGGRPAPTDSPAPPAGCSAWGPTCVSTTSNPTGSSNSLADVASYYYKTDLRPDNVAFPNNVKPKNTGVEDDRATHQHMTTFVLGLGVSGTLQYQDDYRSLATTTGDFADIRTGAKSWPVWPDPTLTYASTEDYNNPKSIDDFWHTAVDGRGTYFSAKDPAQVVTGLGDALSSIDLQVASGSGDAASTLEPVAGNNFAYSTSYQTGSWMGDLQAFQIDLATGGLVGAPTPTPLWSAGALLGQQTKAACDNRKIYLVKMGSELVPGGGENLVDFSWNTYACDSSGLPTGAARSALDATDQGNFSKTNAIVNHFGNWLSMSATQQDDAAGANLVNFLRGQRGHEGFVAGVDGKLYRTRASVLGDLVNSQPVYVGKPFARYADVGYADFITAQSARAPAVYVGGNDGMLHAFDATTGNELWAIIPRAVLPGLWRLGEANYNVDHRFFVDGSPVVGDVYDGTNWRTILVVGLNAGGKAYDAVDITDPSHPKVLWEFASFTGAACPAGVGDTSDCNLGLTYGVPVITKVNGNWVVLVTSGYNNVTDGGDGGGYLYAINAATGQLAFKIATGVGSAATPSGLAQVNAFVENTFVDNTSPRAYGGDQMGNLWRFELPTPSAQLLGVAKTSGGLTQPISTRPELSEVENNPMIMVGTGRLLGASDVSDTEQQSVYGFLDTLAPGPVYPDLRGSLRPLTMTQVGTGATAVRTIACSGSEAECARTAGWVLDLPEAGERVNINMKLNFGTLVFASNVPKAESCTVGGHSWFNYVDYQSGLAVPGAATIDLGDGTTGQVSSSYIADSLTTGFNIYRLPAVTGSGSNNGSFVTGFVQSDTSHPVGNNPPPYPLPSGKRISWREIVK